MSSRPTNQSRLRPHRISDFQELMQRRVENILLVSSPYDCYILEEDGALAERVMGEFLDLGLRHTPGVTRVSTGAEALALALEERRFNLIITSIQVGDMNAVELARQVRALGLDIPVVLLAYDTRELQDFAKRNDLSKIDRAFLWQGDVRILLAIVKYVEDKLNVAYDTGVCGVPVVVVVEDNVLYYSSFLPMIYTELVKHSQHLISEGVNLTHKILRMRARPKLLLASTYEEAWDYLSRYHDNILGLISDIEFPKGGESMPLAGVELVKRVREVTPDMPIVLQSSRQQNELLAKEVGASFLLKGSPLLLNDLRRCMVEYFSFGDFTFRMPDGREVGRAHDLRTLEELVHTVPVESIGYHGERNHFSKWLRARTEFAIADRLGPRRIEDYPDFEAVRADLVASLAEYRRELTLGAVADFDRFTFDGTPGMYRLGGGSLGGKARGLAFVRRMLADSSIHRRFPDIEVGVPRSVVVGTDVFDRFLEENDLRDFVINCPDDQDVHARIMDAALPADTREDLAVFIEHADYPLAVRSSSLLEDSQYQPWDPLESTCRHASLSIL